MKDSEKFVGFKGSGRQPEWCPPFETQTCFKVLVGVGGHGGDLNEGIPIRKHRCCKVWGCKGPVHQKLGSRSNPSCLKPKGRATNVMDITDNPNNLDNIMPLCSQIAGKQNGRNQNNPNTKKSSGSGPDPHHPYFGAPCIARWCFLFRYTMLFCCFNQMCARKHDIV